MRDKDLYARILGIEPPWQVEDVTLRLEGGEVEVQLTVAAAAYRCPVCGQACPGYDSRERRWRHLDTCQYQTILRAAVPRVQCPTHGVVQIALPWAEGGSRFTALFEALVIDWLRAASLTAVARQLRLSWDEVDRIQARAVARGLARRERAAPRRIGVDETAFQKRHEYVTVVCDLERERVLHVADEHKESSLAEFYQALGPERCAGLEVICVDMWRPYLAATRAYVPDAEQKIAFDRFHVAQLLGDAVDEVRRGEHRRLRTEGDLTLRGTRFWWLTTPASLDAARWRAFAPLRRSALKTARAWAIKELARSLWHYRSRTWARKAWHAWLAWALRCRLGPIRAVAETIRKYLWGILNAIVARATNARTEGINARIQDLKRRACGYRSRERFRQAIYFHLGGLDLYPAGARPTHTNA